MIHQSKGNSVPYHTFSSLADASGSEEMARKITHTKQVLGGLVAGALVTAAVTAYYILGCYAMPYHITVGTCFAPMIFLFMGGIFYHINALDEMYNEPLTEQDMKLINEEYQEVGPLLSKANRDLIRDKINELNNIDLKDFKNEDLFKNILSIKKEIGHHPNKLARISLLRELESKLYHFLNEASVEKVLLLSQSGFKFCELVKIIHVLKSEYFLLKREKILLLGSLIEFEESQLKQAEIISKISKEITSMMKNLPTSRYEINTSELLEEGKKCTSDQEIKAFIAKLDKLFQQEI